MRNTWKVLSLLGLLMGIGGAANATTVEPSFSCTAGSFLSTLTFSNDTTASGTGTFGEICVTLVDSNTAFIQAESFAGFTMVGGNSLALNINGTATCTGGTAGACVNGSITNVGGGPFSQDFPATDQVDGLGDLNFHISEGNASSGATFLSFTIDSSGPFASAADVLANNASGFDAAMHLNVLGSDCGEGSPCTFFAGENTPGIIIGETPEPAILSLLGVALVGMGFGWRQRQA